MKIIISAIIVLLSISSGATLKVQGQVNGYNDNKDPRPQIGLAYYQPIFIKNVALNAWAGTGQEVFPDKTETRWYSAKASMDFIFKDLTAGIGFQSKDSNAEGAEIRHHAFLKFEYKLM